MKFVDEIAEYIEENKLDLDHLVIILPSVRAKKYVERAIVNKKGKTIFAPTITTIDRWIRDASTLIIQDKLALIFDLYQVHLLIIDPEEDASFDFFFSWVPQLLSDFDELEKYLVDAKSLFKNLRDIREIEKWSPEDEPLTNAQEEYLKFWDRLQHYYQKFKDRLAEKNQGYNGMAFREVAENIELVWQKNKEARFLFAGFNALSLAEMSIMKKLVDLQKGHVLMDADAYYLKENHHEAGHFLRELQRFLGATKLRSVKNKMLTEEKNIELIECSQNIAQVNVASSLLSKMQKQEIDRTLVLLADEDLVSPMIKNLPSNIEKANITMGIELKNTSVKLWVDILFSMQENKERFSNNNVLYHKDLARLWKHPCFLAVLPKECAAKQIELEQRIIQKNNLFVGTERLSLGNDFLKGLYNSLCSSWNQDWNNSLLTIRHLNATVFDKLGESETFEKGILMAFDKSVQQFSNSWNAQPVPEMSLRIFKQLFQMHYGKATIAYEGNPVEGLQIMGLLETRLLDFDRIICLGMNEGKMPPGNPIQTLIPMDLRAGVGMPTTREKNGLFAHHFYRLLHDVQDLTITYVNRREDMMSSEASRYLLQMELEWKRENPNLKLTKKQYHLNATTKSFATEKVEKTPELLAKIDEVLGRSMSASLLNKFINCPLDFYYRYLLEYGEEEEVEEELQMNTFGTILHDALEEMYDSFAIINKEGKVNPTAKPLEVADILKMKTHADEKIKQGFLKNYDQDIKAFSTGKNYLRFEMAKKLLNRFLDFEIKRIASSPDSIWIYALELSLYRDLQFEIDHKVRQVKMHGKIDRIEVLQKKGTETSAWEIEANRLNERLHVVDYKSGKVGSESLNFKTAREIEDVLDKTFNKSDGRYILQLLFYGYLIQDHIKTIPENLSIISFISYPDEGLTLKTAQFSNKEIYGEFENALATILNKIYNVDVPFEHSDNYEMITCAYCD